MWARVVEALLGVWLILAAVLFGMPDATDATTVPLVAGIATLLLSALATRLRHAHLLVLLVAVGLIAWGWSSFPRPGPAAAQNAILVGLTLGLFGIIPNQAHEPPVGWRPYSRSDDGRPGPAES